MPDRNNHHHCQIRDRGSRTFRQLQPGCHRHRIVFAGPTTMRELALMILFWTMAGFGAVIVAIIAAACAIGFVVEREQRRATSCCRKRPHVISPR